MKSKIPSLTAFLLCMALFTSSLWEGVQSELGSIHICIKLPFSCGMYIVAIMCCFMNKNKTLKRDDILFFVMSSFCALFALFCGAAAVYKIAFAAVLMALLMIKMFMQDNTKELQCHNSTRDNRILNNIEERYARSREMWHDMRNHFAVLNEYIASGDYEGMKAYTADFCDEVERIIIPFRTGSMAADIILGDKLYLARSHMIHTEIDVDDLSALSMRDADICAVLGNLLDNAVEACLKINEAERYIKIKARWNGNVCCFLVENSCDNTTTEYSTKLNKNEHGIGLRSVERIIHSYGGAFVTDFGKKSFKAAAELR